MTFAPDPPHFACAHCNETMPRSGSRLHWLGRVCAPCVDRAVAEMFDRWAARQAAAREAGNGFDRRRLRRFAAGAPATPPTPEDRPCA